MTGPRDGQQDGDDLTKLDGVPGDVEGELIRRIKDGENTCDEKGCTLVDPYRTSGLPIKMMAWLIHTLKDSSNWMKDLYMGMLSKVASTLRKLLKPGKNVLFPPRSQGVMGWTY